MKAKYRFIFACTIILLATQPALAEKFNCAFNDHVYDFVDKSCGISWHTARDDAIAAGGYLVTVTSAEEQACLDANGRSGSWWTAGSDAASEDVWKWETGPESGRQFWQGKSGGTTTAPDFYAHWIGGEPNSSGEDYMAWNTGGRWNDVGSTNPIICGYLFEGPPPELVSTDGFENPRKRVFLSSQQYDGNDLGSALAGDVACQGLADAQTLGGTWMAWLSDSSTSPDVRFTENIDGYALVDGTLVAKNYADLIDGEIAALINLTEQGVIQTNATSLRTWTATETGGTFLGSSCSDWSEIAGTGRHGTAAAEALTTPAWWSNRGAFGCNANHSLYCFEQ